LEAGEGSTVDYDKLLVMHERERRALASLAVRLGIASATQLQRPKAASSDRKPWEKFSR